MVLLLLAWPAERWRFPTPLQRTSSFEPEGAAASSMKNGLYSVHVHMLDGVKGRDSGVLILRDGTMIGGGPYFWSSGSYTVGNGTWKGHLRTNQHTRFADPFVRPHVGRTGSHQRFLGDIRR